MLNGWKNKKKNSTKFKDDFNSDADNDDDSDDVAEEENALLNDNANNGKVSYLVDIMETFRKKDNNNYEVVKTALLNMNKVICSKPNDLYYVCNDLCKILLHLENTYNMANFLYLRHEALVSLILLCPKQILQWLPNEVYDNEYTIGDRLEICNILIDSARQMANLKPLYYNTNKYKYNNNDGNTNDANNNYGNDEHLLNINDDNNLTMEPEIEVKNNDNNKAIDLRKNNNDDNESDTENDNVNDNANNDKILSKYNKQRWDVINSRLIKKTKYFHANKMNTMNETINLNKFKENEFANKYYALYIYPLLNNYYKHEDLFNEFPILHCRILLMFANFLDCLTQYSLNIEEISKNMFEIFLIYYNNENIKYIEIQRLSFYLLFRILLNNKHNLLLNYEWFMSEINDNNLIDNLMTMLLNTNDNISKQIVKLCLTMICKIMKHENHLL